MFDPPTINGRLPLIELQFEMFRSIMLYGRAVVVVDGDTVAVTRTEPRSLPLYEGVAAWAERYSTTTAATPTVSSDGTS